jgi:sensor histidine kinase regulating citrate/malate metabolism
MSNYYKVLILVLSLIAVLWASNNMHYYNNLKYIANPKVDNIEIFLLFALAMITFITFVLIERNEHLAKIVSLNNTIRTLRHDLNNHIQALYGLIQFGYYSEAKEYMENYFSIVKISIGIKKIAISKVEALILSKLAIAEQKNVKFQVDINWNPSIPLNISIVDLNTVLGNLLDNAIDAAADFDKHHNVLLIMNNNQNTQSVYVEVINSGTLPKNKSDIFKLGFTSKSKGQGLGLYSVRKIVHKYNGAIKVDSDNEVTKFTVSLPN